MSDYDDNILNSRELQKQNMLDTMKDEINLLEDEIRKKRLCNLKNGTIRNLKISLRFMELLAPYILTFTIITGGFKLGGLGFPFYRDNVKVNPNIKKTIDSFGSCTYEKQVESFKNNFNILCYYSKWEQCQDKTYSRNVEIYSLGRLTEEDIFNFYNIKDLKLSDILGDPISVSKETTANISKDKLAQKDYFQAMIYYKDEDDYIIVKEPIENDFGVSLLYIFITILGQLDANSFKNKFLNFDLDYHLYRIKLENPRQNISELVKRLEIKKSNYKRLMR